MEDAIDAFKMIFAGGQSWLLIWTLVNIVSHAFWNYAGNKCNMRIGGVIETSRTSLQLFAAVSVTKELSATTKSVLDQVLYCTVLYCTVLCCTVLEQVRIVIVWAVFLLPWGGFLCRVQDTFNWVEVSGSVLN